MVGSDRIAAFKKYNQALGDNLFKKFDIRCLKDFRIKN